jgi:hypothetical protein
MFLGTDFEVETVILTLSRSMKRSRSDYFLMAMVAVGFCEDLFEVGFFVKFRQII